MILLDTSSLRAISSENLRIISEKKNINISPITFYELLCHLDEDENFNRMKGNIVKCEFVNILHDPFASHAMSVGVDELVNPTRFEDPFMIRQIIENLVSTDSLKEFYQKTVAFPDGEKSSCEGISQNIRRLLDEEENKYLQNIDKVQSEISKIIPDSKNMDISPEQMSNMIKSGIKHLEEFYAAQGIKEKDLLYNIACSLYIFLGYKIARTLKYIEAGIASGHGFKPDRNDCEDAYITIHLNLFRNDLFVTNDKGTIQAIDYTIKSFIEMVKNRVKVGIMVIDSDELQRRFL